MYRMFFKHGAHAPIDVNFLADAEAIAEREEEKSGGSVEADYVEELSTGKKIYL